VVCIVVCSPRRARLSENLEDSSKTGRTDMFATFLLLDINFCNMLKQPFEFAQTVYLKLRRTNTLVVSVEDTVVVFVVPQRV